MAQGRPRPRVWPRGDPDSRVWPRGDPDSRVWPRGDLDSRVWPRGDLDSRVWPRGAPTPEYGPGAPPTQSTAQGRPRPRVRPRGAPDPEPGAVQIAPRLPIGNKLSVQIVGGGGRSACAYLGQREKEAHWDPGLTQNKGTNLVGAVLRRFTEGAVVGGEGP